MARRTPSHPCFVYWCLGLIESCVVVVWECGKTGTEYHPWESPRAGRRYEALPGLWSRRGTACCVDNVPIVEGPTWPVFLCWRRWKDGTVGVRTNLNVWLVRCVGRGWNEFDRGRDGRVDVEDGVVGGPMSSALFLCCWCLRPPPVFCPR